MYYYISMMITAYNSFMIFFLVILHAADMLGTMYLVYGGHGYEENPTMAAALNESPFIFILVKLIGVLVSTFFFWCLRDEKFMTIVITVIVIIYGVEILNQLELFGRI